MKLFRSFLITLMLVVAFTFTVSAADVVFKFGHHYPMGHPHTLGTEYFKKLVEEKTDGRIEIQLYPNNQLGNSHQLWESIQLGSVDIILTDPGAPVFSGLPLWDLVMGPFMYRDFGHAFKVAHSPMMKKMYDECEEKTGVTIIDPIWNYGVRFLTTAKTRVETPEDLKGLKIRTPEIPGFIKAIEVIGGNPTPISFPDLYMALKQGVVDGQENPAGIIYSNKFYEAQKYVIKTGHILSKNTVYMNTAKLNKLSREDQQIIKEAIYEAGRYNDLLLEKNEVEMLEKLKEVGMEIVEPDLEKFRARAKKGLMDWFNEEQLEFYNKIQNIM